MGSNSELVSYLLIGLIIIFVITLLFLIYQLFQKKNTSITTKILTVLYIAIVSTPLLGYSLVTID